MCGRVPPRAVINEQITTFMHHASPASSQIVSSRWYWEGLVMEYFALAVVNHEAKETNPDEHQHQFSSASFHPKGELDCWCQYQPFKASPVASQR